MKPRPHGRAASIRDRAASSDWPHVYSFRAKRQSGSRCTDVLIRHRDSTPSNRWHREKSSLPAPLQLRLQGARLASALARATRTECKARRVRGNFRVVSVTLRTVVLLLLAG